VKDDVERREQDAPAAQAVAAIESDLLAWLRCKCNRLAAAPVNAKLNGMYTGCNRKGNVFACPNGGNGCAVEDHVISSQPVCEALASSNGDMGLLFHFAWANEA
jgi:hypothetical protein